MADMTEKPPTQQSPRALLPIAVVFVVLLGIMWWGFDQALSYRHYPNQDLAATSVASGPVILDAGWDGHFRVPGTINGTRVRFLVDTGASTIAIPGSLARTMHVTRGPRIEVQTASGPTVAYLARLDTVTVGNIVRHNVRAAVIPSMEQSTALLGMSFLDNVNMLKRGDKLILKEQP